MRVSRQIYFSNEKISHAKIAQKAQKAQNTNKRLSLRCFLCAQKAQKAQNIKQAIFFFLDVFYAYKNAVFFVSHTKKAQKAQKAQKSIKTQISE